MPWSLRHQPRQHPPLQLLRRQRRPLPREPGLDVQAHVKQAFSYISNAKNAREAYIREESIENAVKEFSMAIQKDPGYAEAYSNRAAAYMLQRKFNKAEEDLRKAKELSPDSPSIRYNYASLHSLRGNVDLALDEIDAALAKGFSDYDALRRDPDLENLRRSPEFRKVLENTRSSSFADGPFGRRGRCQVSTGFAPTE